MLDLSRIADALKLPVRIFVALTLVSGIILFAPDSFLGTLGLREFQETFKTWIAIVFLGSGAISFVSVPVWGFLIRDLRTRLLIHKGKEHLKQLTLGEKKILRNYVLDDTRTNVFWIAVGEVRELEAQRILRRASEASYAGGGFPYNIQPWAWKYLKARPELLE